MPKKEDIRAHWMLGFFFELADSPQVLVSPFQRVMDNLTMPQIFVPLASVMVPGGPVHPRPVSFLV